MRLLLDRWYILGPCAALLVFVSLVLFSNQDWRDHEAARVRIDDAQVVIRQASTLVHLLADAETGQREYILTADAEALRICEDSLNRIPAVLENLRRAKPMGKDSTDKIVELGRKAEEELRRALEERRRGDFAAARALMAANRVSAEAAQTEGQQIVTSQRNLLAAQNRRTDLQEQRVRTAILGSAVFLFLLLVVSSIHIPLLIKRLKVAQQRYSLLFESNPQPMWVYDRATLKFVAVNHAAVEYYGYSEADFRRMELKDIQLPEEMSKLPSSGPEAGGPYQEGPCRLRKSDGTVITVETIEHPMTFDGRPSALVIVRDITAQQQTEGALRKSREQLQLALDAANEGLWDWTVTTGEGHFSPRYYMILGYGPGEVPSDHQGWRNLVHPDDLESATEQRTEQIARQNGAFAIEYRMRRKAGDYLWVQSRGRVIEWTPDGKPGRIVGTITDINDRKALEAQFQQAQRLESLGRLAGGVAHDFNNLLTVIGGYAEMALSQTEPGHPAYGSLEEIRDAGNRAASLTQQLLAFSRKHLLQPAVVNINRSVQEADKLLRRLIGEQITLVTHLSPELGNIKADAGQLQQIIINLAVNSRDAMPDGGRLIIQTANALFDDAHTRRHPEARAGHHVMLSIRDTGAGMAPEVKERIFEPFFTTKPKGVGTGLGLAMVHGIVMQSGGWIQVSSEPGRGSTFEIYFPRTDEPLQLRDPDASTEAHGAETVLVVEDQPEVRTLAATALQRYGYEVHTCASGEDALEFSAGFDRTIHLLVSDVIMPGMDGMGLAKVLRKQRTGLRTLLISGYTDSAIPQNGVLDGEIAYLQKPFTPRQLAEKAREVLGK